VSASVLLVHGGLWDTTDAEAFWGTTGIAAGLASYGLDVHAPNRPREPATWGAEVDALGELLSDLSENRDTPVAIVGASNGCTVAALLALRFADLVDRLLLAWPATGGDAVVNAGTRTGLIGRGCPAAVADELLAGGVLRGVLDADLPTLARIPVAVMPSVPENPSHQRKTVDALLRSIQGSRELAGCPEPPTPSFPPYLDQLVRSTVAFVTGSTA
jgi:pimeloyl-ACP methyl ester carboxylesterase